ncbi:NmrA family transcriptional regulator [Mesorhizobium intechi]|uniref:NmrA family transcriptional regulator n=1 Tax=Mesorhizobium intechi TaxID=537601 RepID=A0A8T9ATC0_9HYPH|nr:NAD(P)H-binding protein [Mesorhizobium intechi]TSE10295.1 NmrA family transcriptional regulator [Mesorhizobium intechi]
MKDTGMFVVLGAAGKIGRATIGALRRHRVPVRALVRNPSHAEEFRGLGCDAEIADLRDTPAVARAAKGAAAVQVICPTGVRADDASAEMEATIRSVVNALDQVRPQRILAISDYGAQLAAGTGITLTFHHLETQLRTIPAALTLLRSAEHMQNWNRLAGLAIETGVLPSLHHPVTKSFPTVSAGDVGLMAADLLLSGSGDALRVVHAEGPDRYSAADVARTLGEIAGRAIVARELPRQDWVPALIGGGIGTSYAELVAAMFDAHNAGRIDVEHGVGEVRRGDTDLRTALAALVARS